jgi:predicted Zn-dependent peptidase
MGLTQTLVTSPSVRLLFGVCLPLISAKGSPTVQISTLADGITLIVEQMKAASDSTVSVTYRTGSDEDVVGRCGTAHLVEHLMFRGSTGLADGEFGFWIARVGGVFQASTGEHRTIYYEIVPTNQLPLVVHLEALLMTKALTFSDGILHAEKHNVIAELALRHRAGLMQSVELEHSVRGVQKRACPPGGDPRDIETITRRDIENFRREHYRLTNAVVVIVGNVDLKKTVMLVCREFHSDQVITGRHLTSTDGPPLLHRGPPIIEDTRSRVATQKPGITLEGSNDPRQLRLFLAMHNPGSMTWCASILLGSVLARQQGSPLKTVLDRLGFISAGFRVHPQLGYDVGVLTMMFVKPVSPKEVAGPLAEMLKTDKYQGEYRRAVPAVTQSLEGEFVREVKDSAALCNMVSLRFSLDNALFDSAKYLHNLRSTDADAVHRRGVIWAGLLESDHHVHTAAR